MKATVTISVGGGIRLAAALLREQRALRRATKRMPKPVPWDWARPRLLPLLAGPMLDHTEDEPLRAVAEAGCALVFGIDAGGGIFPMVDAPVAERWECTVRQIRDVAFDNLRRRAARLEPSIVSGGTLSGRIIRIMKGGVPWASSLVLVEDELKRLFGGHDQIFITPGRGTVISFPSETPASTVVDVLDDFERSETYPLMLEPFMLSDGELLWGGALEDEFDRYEG